MSLGLTALALAFGGRADAAAPFAAGATVNPATQYLDDSAGSMLTFTVANTGTTSSIGAVEINRPDGSFKLTQCPLAPFGWKVQAAETKCRYRSADGTADDIKPGKSASFSVRSKTDPGTQDRTGVWNVQVSKTNQFDAGSMTAASGSPTTKVHSFQVLDAGVAGGPASPGSACPVLSHAETTAATRNIVVCGRNRASLTLAPNAANSSLAGTWLGAPGTFSSAGVPPSASSRVLGTWQGAAISSSFGPGKSVIAKIGSAANRTSPSTTLTGYEGLNRPPDAAADSATTDEDTASGQIDVLANDSDPDPGDTFSITGHDTTGSTGGTVSQVGNKFVFDPNGNFEDLAPTEHRDSLFTYTVTDNHGASSAGTVTVTVTGLNDATTAVADTASTPENATKVINVLGNDTDPDTNQTLAVVSVDITGTKGAVTNNGDNVTYDPNGQFSSLGPGDTDTDTFKYKANDGVGDSNTATVTVTITGTNSSPVVSNVEGTALAYDTGTTATVSPGVTVTDADTTPLTGATVSITAGYANGNDTLALPAPVGPITGSFNTSNGVLTLDGDGTPAQYQSALQSVTYHATEPTASGSRTVQFQVNDG
ncbi:MAG TPA: Ig-like domain-containing protein, partial [Acidimicrobiales bacterium]|nr:Ig-like domain-containing protein [Acidimicrobiales bacterium]